MRNLLVAAIAALSGTLSACGTYVPKLAEIYEGTNEYADLSPSGLLEYNIKEKIYCGIVDAVVGSRQAGLLPTGWAVQTTLSLQVDETGAINPGVSFIEPLQKAQSFTFGVGANVSSQGTRESKSGSYWELDRLRSRTGVPCRKDGVGKAGSSPLLVNELGISEWLLDSLQSRHFIPSSEGDKKDPFFKQDYMSYHVRFVVMSGATATPTWKLIRIASGNGGLPLASVGRTRTHDLLLTFGPTFKAGAPNLAASAHAAQDFGIAVSNGTRAPTRAFVVP